MVTNWPEADLMAARQGKAFYRGAAICRRGHTETQIIRPGEARDLGENCTKCGARLLTSCPQCELRIRGKRFSPGVASASSAARPSFCDGCGLAFPWATREERILELENLLDEEEVDEADRVVIQDQLLRLRSESLSEKDERQVWETVKRRGGHALSSGPVQRVLEGLVSAAIRSQIGL